MSRTTDITASALMPADEAHARSLRSSTRRSPRRRSSRPMGTSTRRFSWMTSPSPTRRAPHPARPLRHAAAVRVRCVVRRIGSRCRAADGSARGVASPGRELAPVHRHGERLLAAARARDACSAWTTSCRQTTPTRSTTASPTVLERAGLPPAGPLRPLRHRGARDDRRPARRSRDASRHSRPTGAVAGRVIPTFRPDAYLDPAGAGFADRVQGLLDATGRSGSFDGYLRAPGRPPRALHRARRGLGRPWRARALHRRPLGDRRRASVPRSSGRAPRRGPAAAVPRTHAVPDGPDERGRRSRHDHPPRRAAATTTSRRSRHSDPTPGTTSRCAPSTRRTCGRCSTPSARPPASTSSSSPSTRRCTRAKWRPSRASTRASSSARRGGSSMRPTRSCASAAPSPRPRASIAGAASSTTRARSSRSRLATTWPVASTPPSSRALCERAAQACRQHGASHATSSTPIPRKAFKL